MKPELATWNVFGALVLTAIGVWALIIEPIREAGAVRRARGAWLADRANAPGEVTISNLATSDQTWAGIARVVEDLAELPASAFRPEDSIDALDDLGGEPLDILRPLRREFAIRLPSRRVLGAPWGKPLKPTFACLYNLIIEEEAIRKAALR